MLIIASQNKGKLREIAELPGAEGLELISITDYPGCPDVAEEGTSFEENAAIKAVKYSLWLKRDHGIWPPVVAEDSGLSVEGLLGWPGVFSARIADTDEARIAAVLERSAGLASRTARFTAVTAIAVNGVLLKTFTGYVQGALIDAPRGANGFGYDPIFEDPASGRTFAEMPAAEKNKISHRARAWEKLFKYVHGADVDAPADRSGEPGGASQSRGAEPA